MAGLGRVTNMMLQCLMRPSESLRVTKDGSFNEGRREPQQKNLIEDGRREMDILTRNMVKQGATCLPIHPPQ